MAVAMLLQSKDDMAVTLLLQSKDDVAVALLLQSKGDVGVTLLLKVKMMWLLKAKKLRILIWMWSFFIKLSF